MIPRDLARFEARCVLEPNSGCWLWDGHVSTDGYGRLMLWNGSKSRSARAHRLSYEHFVGPITGGLFVLHRCDVPCCVNPGHLFLGTHQANMDDKVAKGRQARSGGARGEAHSKAKLTRELVATLRARMARGETVAAIARSAGVSVAAASDAINGKTWAHVPMPSGAGVANDNDERGEKSAM